MAHCPRWYDIRSSRLTFLLLAVVSALSACASSRGTGVAAGLKRELGTATLRDVQRQVPLVLHRYQYEIERDDASSSLLTIQTRWNSRYPFQDEIDSGAVQARTRLILTARSRFRTGGPADVRVVELLAENMVWMGDSLRWRSGFTTAMFDAYIDRIADELKTELQAGIRVH